MSQFAWPEQVATLSNMLNTVEASLKTGDPVTAGLAEFKSALDDLRLRTWSLLSAVNADDPGRCETRVDRDLVQGFEIVRFFFAAE